MKIFTIHAREGLNVRDPDTRENVPPGGLALREPKFRRWETYWMRRKQDGDVGIEVSDSPPPKKSTKKDGGS